MCTQRNSESGVFVLKMHFEEKQRLSERLSMGPEGFICYWEILPLNSLFLVPKIPSPLQKKTGRTQDGTTPASLWVVPSP